MELKEYRFFDQIAVQYGVDEAIFLHNLHFWVKKNTETRKNFKNGKYWTYNSAAQFKEIFPFWSISKIYSIINGLVKGGVILKDNTLNKNKYDRTSWYTFSDIEKWNFIFEEKQLPNQEMDLPEKQNPNDESDEILPDINTGNETENKETKFEKQEFEKQDKGSTTDISTGEILPPQGNIDDNHVEEVLKQVKEIFFKSDYSRGDYDELISIQKAPMYSTIENNISISRKQELREFSQELSKNYSEHKSIIIQEILNQSLKVQEELHVYLLISIAVVLQDLTDSSSK